MEGAAGHWSDSCPAMVSLTTLHADMSGFGNDVDGVVTPRGDTNGHTNKHLWPVQYKVLTRAGCSDNRAYLVAFLNIFWTVCLLVLLCGISE